MCVCASTRVLPSHNFVNVCVFVCGLFVCMCKFKDLKRRTYSYGIICRMYSYHVEALIGTNSRDMREENTVSDLNSGNVRMRERKKTVYSQYIVRAQFLSDQLFTIPKCIMMRLQNADDSSQPIF